MFWISRAKSCVKFSITVYARMVVSHVAFGFVDMMRLSMLCCSLILFFSCDSNFTLTSWVAKPFFWRFWKIEIKVFLDIKIEKFWASFHYSNTFQYFFIISLIHWFWFCNVGQLNISVFIIHIIWGINSDIYWLIFIETQVLSIGKKSFEK